MQLNKCQEYGCCLENINRPIALCRTAMNQLRDVSPYLPDLHNLIAVGFKQRYFITADPVDLDNAIENWHIGLKKTRRDSDLAAKFFHNLGNGLICRFEIKSSESDLEESIEMMQEGLKYTTEDPVFNAKRLNSLGDGFIHQYYLKGHIIDLERSINNFHKSLDLLNGIDARIKPVILSNLCIGYLELYKYVGSISCLDKSEYFCDKAMEDINETNVIYPIILNNKGCIFRERYLLNGEIISLENAVLNNV